MDKVFIQKLAVERCRVYVSQLCALTHLSSEAGLQEDFLQDSLYGLFERLSRDLEVIENTQTDC